MKTKHKLNRLFHFTKIHFLCINQTYYTKNAFISSIHVNIISVSSVCDINELIEIDFCSFCSVYMWCKSFRCMPTTWRKVNLIVANSSCLLKCWLLISPNTTQCNLIFFRNLPKRKKNEAKIAFCNNNYISSLNSPTIHITFNKRK